jgi:hypothetical protein
MTSSIKTKNQRKKKQTKEKKGSKEKPGEQKSLPCGGGLGIDEQVQTSFSQTSQIQTGINDQRKKKRKKGKKSWPKT